jgi:hypothetical protein
VPSFARPPSSRFEPLPMTPVAADACRRSRTWTWDPKIPNYKAAGREALTKMQLPLSPADSRKHYSTPQGFQLELFASEDHFAGKPIAMNWDGSGGLFVDFAKRRLPERAPAAGKGPRPHPHLAKTPTATGKPTNSTRVRRKPQHSDRHRVPSRRRRSVQDGVETLFLKDTDGDDRQRTSASSSSAAGAWATPMAASATSSGDVDWVWAMQGYNGSTPEYGDGKKSPSFRQGFFRFQMAAPSGAGWPAVADLEFIRSSNNNTWGFGMSEEGLIFGSTANHNPSMFMPIANRYYERVRGWSARRSGRSPTRTLFKAITENVRQVDQFGGYAAAPAALDTARTCIRPAFWNSRTAFVRRADGPLGRHVRAQPRRRRAIAARAR